MSFDDTWMTWIALFSALVCITWAGISTLSTLGHLDLHGGWCQCSELFGHSLTDALEHRGATREDHVCVQVLADIHVTSGVYILGSKNRS